MTAKNAGIAETPKQPSAANSESVK